mgnify:CR=1 FL=1|jgi:hypothetical protein
MSLKSFHIIFISVTLLFTVYFSYWSYIHWMNFNDSSYIVYLLLSTISFLLLSVYSKKFIKKFKSII